MEKHTAFPWLENVRELQNMLKRIMVMGSWDEMVEELVDGADKEKASAFSAYPKEMPIVAELVGSDDKFFTNYHYCSPLAKDLWFCKSVLFDC
jgi:DNA-binding NtrC family response regulator